MTDAGADQVKDEEECKDLRQGAEASRRIEHPAASPPVTGLFERRALAPRHLDAPTSWQATLTEQRLQLDLLLADSP